MSCHYTPDAQRLLKTGPGRPRKAAHLLEVSDPNSDIKKSDDDTKGSTVTAPLEQNRFSLDLADIELLHHYYTVAWATLCEDEPGQKMYQSGIPHMALSYPFLLRLLLALAGLHLRHVHSKTGSERDALRYELLAEKHFSAAIPQLKFLTSDCSRENCQIAHVSAILVCIHILARGPMPGEYLAFSDQDSTTLWMGLLRGVKRIRSVFEDVEFVWPPAAPASTLPPKPEVATVVQFDLPPVKWKVPLRDLECFVASHIEPKYKDMYCTAITALIQSFQATYGNDESGSFDGDPMQKIVFRWLYVLDDRMVELLQQKEPHALIVFGYYAVLLRVTELVGAWFTLGWSRHILQGVYTLLEEQYRHWLKWPFETVGLAW